MKDLEDIPANIRAEVDIIPVGHMDRVLKEALASPPVFRGDSGAPESGGVASSAEP